MNKDCKTKEWDIKLKAKKSPRFKAGSKLADKVNKMNVDINEESDETTATTDVKMEIEQYENDILKIALKKKRKTRFKAGADLTDKVNLISVDLEEEATESLDSCRLKMKLESEDNERIELNLKKRATRFKAGADLTEKVNLVDVDWIDEHDGEIETLSVSIKIVSSVCPIHISEKAEISAN
jgi:nucleoid DNA-binding protein